MVITFNNHNKNFCIKCFILGFSIFLAFAGHAVLSQHNSNRIPVHRLWPRPEIIPIPTKTSNVEDPLIWLNGTWFINTLPGREYWNEKIDTRNWKEIVAPGSIGKQGVNVRRGEEYAYKKNIPIPEDFKNERVILRFEGITGTAKAGINRNFLKEHYGGFNVGDITGYGIPGQEAILTVGIVDETRENSTSSFNPGGIIRSVKLMAVPQNHITRFNVETDLDDNYKNAEMKVWTRVSFNHGKEGKVKVTLKDPSGNIIDLQNDKVTLTKEQPETMQFSKVNDPLTWDAEHPDLYTLRLELVENKQVMEVVTKKVGFREIAIECKKMLVNGINLGS